MGVSEGDEKQSTSPEGSYKDPLTLEFWKRATENVLLPKRAVTGLKKGL